MDDLILHFARKWREIIDVRGPEDVPEMKADLEYIEAQIWGERRSVKRTFEYGTATPWPVGDKNFQHYKCDKCGKVTRSSGMGVHLKYCKEGV